MQQGHAGNGGMSAHMVRKHYWMLALNLAISLVIMYVVMFSMIWRFADFFNNSNMFYMALLMWAPMGILMLLMMGMMYPNKRLNMMLHAAFAMVILFSYLGIRDQLLFGDRKFAREMIPHHSGAITMCNRSSIRDPELRELCFGPRGIVASQEREIAQMKAILERL